MKTITDKDRKQIYNILAESYIDLVSRGAIGKYERRVVSKKVLEEIEAAQSYEDVYNFLNSLVDHYPAFSTAMVQIKSEISKVHEDQVMDRLQSFIKSATK